MGFDALAMQGEQVLRGVGSLGGIQFGGCGFELAVGHHDAVDGRQAVMGLIFGHAFEFADQRYEVVVQRAQVARVVHLA